MDICCEEQKKNTTLNAENATLKERIESMEGIITTLTAESTINHELIDALTKERNEANDKVRALGGKV